MFARSINKPVTVVLSFDQNAHEYDLVFNSQALLDNSSNYRIMFSCVYLVVVTKEKYKWT